MAASTPSALSAALVKSLQRSNAELADSHADADYVLRIDGETIRRRPVASTGQASVAEYELRLEVGFSVLAQERLIGSGDVSVERIYQFDSSSLAGNTAEEALLTREMREDVSGQLLRRLDALIRSAD
jgi:outer membrane lipopolysaccharide assembly protein LptE/RlpB